MAGLGERGAYGNLAGEEPVSQVFIVIPSFKGVERCRYMLNTMKKNDPDAFRVPILVVEDPCGDPAVSAGYDKLFDEFPLIGVRHLPEWSNMHGAAMKSFELAFNLCDPDWVIYLGDDLAMTQGSVSNMIHFLKNNPLDTIGLVQFPYWNAEDLATSSSDNDHTVFWNRDRDFYASMDWIEKVPRNPHWDGEGVARPYVNVNGVGFACRAETYRQVGGFAEGTWCLDESISYRTWMGSNRGIVCLPGPPLVHYFGASTLAGPPAHDLHREERWIEAIGYPKSECDKHMRAKMAEREDNINAEMATANYWSDK